MEDITGLLHITPMESKGKEKGRVYCAHDSLRLSMIELVVSLSSSRQDSHTLGKGRGSGRLRRKHR